MEKIKLNLGAGYRHYGEYINIDKYVTRDDIIQLMIRGDISTYLHPNATYLQADLKSLPFKDESVDYIESLDTLDHFSFREVGTVVGEIFRVLKTGSMVRIQVPNFDAVARVWTAMIEQKGEVNLSAEWLGNYFEISKIIYGNQLSEGLYHKSAWCPAYAYQMFKNEFSFSSINIIILPLGASQHSPLETAYSPLGRKVNMEELVIEAIK